MAEPLTPAQIALVREAYESLAVYDLDRLGMLEILDSHEVLREQQAEAQANVYALAKAANNLLEDRHLGSHGGSHDIDSCPNLSCMAMIYALARPGVQWVLAEKEEGGGS